MNEHKMVNILIIDNNQSNRNDFSDIFKNLNFNVYQASGIENGLEIAEQYVPDIIICSLSTVELSKKLINKIVAHPKIGFLPILYISSSLFEFQELREIMNLGVADFFSKDFNYEDLVKSVQIRVSKYQGLKGMLMDECHDVFETENIRKKDHILINVGKRLQLIKYDHIVCITAEKEYSKIRTVKGKSFIVRKSLKSWLEILPVNNFLRIHRKSIINVNTIEEIEKLKSSAYVIHLKTLSKPLELSRRYSGIMRKAFSGND